MPLIHAPLKSKMVTARPRLPWFSQDINSALRMRRRAEKKWSLIFQNMLIRNRVTFLLNKARCSFYKDFIESNSSDQRKLFKASKKLLGHSVDVLYPPFKDKLSLANDMGSCFVKKISNIHAKLDDLEVSTSVDRPLSFTPETMSSNNLFNSFIPLTESQVKQLVLMDNALWIPCLPTLWVSALMFCFQ